MTENTPQEAKQGRRGGFVFFFIALMVLAAAVLALLRMEGSRKASLETEAQARESVLRAGRPMHVAAAVRGPAERRVELTGEARPYFESVLYAKVSGYLREINVDYGDRVKKGQVLAVIESPELDRQYDASVADAKSRDQDARRARNLVPKGGASEEVAADREASARVGWANVASLAAQKDYEIIRSPFDGTVTVRFADPGALIQNAGSSTGTASPVVTVSQVDRLKIYAYADQKTASAVREDSRAEIWDAAHPEKKISAKLSRTSVQLNARTRTLLLEFDVDNSQGIFVPGSFVQVSLILQTPHYVEVPVEALVFKGDKPSVPVLTAENKVQLRPVLIADSDGKIAAIQSGVQEGDRVVLYGGDRIAEGQLVQPIQTN